MQVNRREFHTRVAQAGLAIGTTAIAGSEPRAAAENEAGDSAEQLRIVDTHQHLWDLDKFRLPWLDAAGPLNRSFVTKDYLEAARGLNIVKAVYMEVAVEPGQQTAEAAHVVELCRRPDQPTVAAVIGGQPASPDFKAYITRWRADPHVKGVRQIVQQPDRLLADDFVAGIRLLGQLGLSFDLCVPPEALHAGAKLVDLCPDTRFILDHCGNADPKVVRPAADGADGDRWRRAIGTLAKRKNIVCKISGIVARADKPRWTPRDLAPAIDHCLDEFGPDRVMFGGDWPVCTRVASLRQWVEALKQIVSQRDERQRRKLFHDNAVRFYGLS